MTQADLADDLLSYIHESPTPYHAVMTTMQRLQAAGFSRLDERETWKLDAGAKHFVVRGDTSVIAFIVGTESPENAGFRMIGAHTDSPNLRLKPNPELKRAGYQQFAVEPYGGVLFHTWLDRDLSLAGRVMIATPQGPKSAFVRFDRPLARIPSLAIHLHRGVNTDGLVLNAQQHLPPLVGIESTGKLDVRELCAQELVARGTRTTKADILAFDLMLFDVQPPTRSGLRNELLHAPRLDNLASCHSSLTALLSSPAQTPFTRVIALYDHEECGSRSAQGADSPFLRHALERITTARSTAADAFARAMTRSYLISADMAHALHPNYTDKHEPAHAPLLGGGPVIKSNVNQSYATDGESAAWFEMLCRRANITPQWFVTRSDLGCGSTIGPITSGQLGVRTVDVGNPMLSMHSIRELCAASDVEKMISVLRESFSA